MAVDSIGKYSVLGTLGSGAHSTILHIRRQADSREYALKIVNIDSKEEMKFLDQARHEFRVAQMLGHPNLIKIFCLETRRNWLFAIKKAEMLIELVNGKTLDETPPLPMPKLVPVFAQVASGLVHMHRRGVYHADLKPNNILFNPKTGQAKIIDYGLAWIKGEAKDRLQGTPEYMAPETVRGKVINEQTEIFNFGATMYRLVTLKLPVNAMAVKDTTKLNEKTWKGMLKQVSELNANVPESLCSLIHSCLEFNPARRPEKMNEVRESLRAIAEELGEPIGEGTDPGN
jgi:serine/threonine protein kinase